MEAFKNEATLIEIKGNKKYLDLSGKIISYIRSSMGSLLF